MLCEAGLREPSEQHLDQGGLESLVQAMNKPSFDWDQAADQIAEYGWSNASSQPITFAFRSSSSEPGFERLDANMIAQTEKAFEAWSDVANISFQRVGSGTTGSQAYSNDATILLSGETSSAGYAWAYYPGSRAAGSLSGDVFFNTTGNLFTDVSEDSYEYLTVLHEIGHAIGLAHPGAYNGGAPSYGSDAEYVQDTRQFTVMSYFNAENSGAFHGWTFASTPLLHDIAAAQALYGANMSTRTGDDVYGFGSNTGSEAFTITDRSDDVVFAVWDAGGEDTFDFSGYRDDQVIDLNEEAFSDVGGLTGNVAIARGVTIENASTGAGDDALIGNDVGNTFEAGSGKDVVHGNGGADTIFGGTSNDTLNGGDGADVISGGKHKDFLYGDAGNDDLSGNTGDDYAYGGDGDDVLRGDSGNDRLFGGAGNDQMIGGSGDDKFIDAVGSDLFDGGSGYDTVDFSGGTTAVMVDLKTGDANSGSGDEDQLISIEEVKATSGNDVLFGDNKDNVFLGLSGDDTFRGRAGSDTFKGGNGTDTYIFNGDDIARDGVSMGVDEILDFSVGIDVLDFSGAGTLGAFGIETAATADGTGTIVQLALDEGPSFDVVVLSGKTDVDVADMLSEGTLIV
ncbi:MAG: M10 family metallopeptidase C-terminal domain-containing protein [Pseudomonadota bacterium]